MFQHVGRNHAVKSRHESVCLQPILVSEAPKEVPVRKYLPSSVYLEEKTDEQKKEEVKALIHSSHVSYDCHCTLMLCAHATQLLSAMVAKLGNMDDPLPQESFEGVDEEEWVSLSKRCDCDNLCYCNDKPPSLTRPNCCYSEGWLERP